MTSDWIAETLFDCLPPQGPSYVLCVRVGRPIVMPAEGQLRAYARCSVSMSPLSDERSIAGGDTFQALCLALHFVRTVLKAFEREGGRVRFPGSLDPIDLDDPSFVPLASLAQLTAPKQSGPQ